MTSFSQRGASTLWIVLLTVASTVTTLALACATPFPALAALAAVHMHRRDGILLMLAAWAASQVVGFGVHHYPHDPRTLAWGVALATAATAAVIAADFAIKRVGFLPVYARLAIGYVVAFVAFKLTVLIWAFGLGGVATTLSPVFTARLFLRNGEILVGLFALYHVLRAIGVPAARAEPVMA